MRFTERSFDKTRLGVEQAGDYGALLIYTHILFSPFAARLRQTKLEIQFDYPFDGPRLIVQNHEGELDAQPMGYVLAHKIKRAPVIVVRESLVAKEAIEDERVIERTGKKNDSLHKDGLIKDLARWIVGQNDYLALRRGSNESFSKLKEDIKIKFEEGRVVLIYGDETRRPVDGIKRFGFGAAQIAAENPDVPVHNAGISGSSIDFKHGPAEFWRTLRGPVVIKISKGETFNQSGAQNIRDFIRFLQSREALLLPDHLVTGTSK